jgi:hypothetical protein
LNGYLSRHIQLVSPLLGIPQCGCPSKPDCRTPKGHAPAVIVHSLKISVERSGIVPHLALSPVDVDRVPDRSCVLNNVVGPASFPAGKVQVFAGPLGPITHLETNCGSRWSPRSSVHSAAANR